MDDILYFSNEEKFALTFKNDLQRNFTIDEMGLMTWLLGCNSQLDA